VEDEVPIPSRWGLATFVHKSIPITGQVQSFVRKEYVPIGYGAHPRRRSAHGVRLYDHTNNRAGSVTHPHGQRDLNGRMNTPERAAQAQRLLEVSRQVSGQNDLAKICEGFNIESDSKTLQHLADAGFVEVVTGRGFTST
jgi:hypothetical protein